VVERRPHVIVRILGSQSPEKVSGGQIAAVGAYTGGELFCMGSDVPDLRSATADRMEGSWQGILLWVVLGAFLWRGSPHCGCGCRLGQEA